MSVQSNGRVRKSLADQLDRLDGLIEALSVGLNEAVASAVQDSVGPAARQAVEAALGELLSNPVTLTLLRQALTGPSPQRPGLLARLRAWLAEQLHRLRGACRRTWLHLDVVLAVVGLAATLAVPFARPWLSWIWGIACDWLAQGSGYLRRTTTALAS